GVLHIKSDAIVPNEVDVFTGSAFVTDIDPRLLGTPREFNRIRQQILEYLSDEPFVAVRGGQRRHLEFNVAMPAACCFLLLKSRRGELINVDIGKHDLFTAEAG